MHYGINSEDDSVVVIFNDYESGNIMVMPSDKFREQYTKKEG